jgi:hypothetical protein
MNEIQTCGTGPGGHTSAGAPHADDLARGLLVSAPVVAAVSAMVIADIMPRPVIGTASAVVIVGVVPGRVIGAAHCGSRAAAIIIGVVPGRVIGALAKFLLSAAVVVGVVARRVVVPTPHHVHFRRVIVPVVMMDALGQAADRGERHAPFQGLQRELLAMPSLVGIHGLAS